MDKVLLQQITYARTMMNLWFMDGENGWDFTSENPVPTDIIVNGRKLDTRELTKHAIELKRAGKYAEAIGSYLHAMAACKKVAGKIPVIYAKGLFKVLVCVNQFDIAFDLVSTVFADMQRSSNVDMNEMGLFKNYFLELFVLARDVVDNNDFSQVRDYATNYSGSSFYTLVQCKGEIKEYLKKVRETCIRMYGQ